MPLEERRIDRSGGFVQRAAGFMPVRVSGMEREPLGPESVPGLPCEALAAKQGRLAWRNPFRIR